MPRSPSRSLSQLEQVYVADRAAWRRWLAAHCAGSPGIWLVFDKKSIRPDRLAYGDAVEEALCHGWIDSLVRRIDDARYEQLFTPRKPTSTWSRTNKERVARLIEQGLMAESGLAAIERAKANGTWTSLDTVESLAVPEDLAAALARSKGAAANFAGFAPSARKGYLHWISQAVRPETRAQRVARVVALAASNQRSRHLEPPPPLAPATRASTAKSTKPASRKSAAKAPGGAAATRAHGTKKAAKKKVAKKQAAKRSAPGSKRRAR